MPALSELRYMIVSTPYNTERVWVEVFDYAFFQGIDWDAEAYEKTLLYRKELLQMSIWKGIDKRETNWCGSGGEWVSYELPKGKGIDVDILLNGRFGLQKVDYDVSLGKLTAVL